MERSEPEGAGAEVTTAKGEGTTGKREQEFQGLQEAKIKQIYNKLWKEVKFRHYHERRKQNG